jgi:hypothetical protein
MRKIVQFQITLPYIHALCEDGSLWRRDILHVKDDWKLWDLGEIPEMDGEFEEVPGPRRPSGVIDKLWAVSPIGPGTGHLITSGSAAAAYDKAGFAVIEASNFDDAIRLFNSQNLIGSRVTRNRLSFGDHEFFYLTDLIPF